MVWAKSLFLVGFEPTILVNFSYNCTQVTLCPVCFVDTHLTRPLVFFNVVAAKSWVTPTRLIPSTSTIWSFTRTLLRQNTNACFIWKQNNQNLLLTLFAIPQRRFYSGFHKSKSKDKFLPSIPVSCTSFGDGLHKNSQLLQSLICPNSHTNYTDSQAIISYTTKQASQIQYFYS